MKAILWKEFRENLKWGVLLLLTSAFGIIALQMRQTNEIVFFNENYMIQAAFGFAAGALALGILRTVFEGSRDRWAFLMHRGISPERILTAKAIVGLTYVVAATAIPIFGMAWWCSRPGNVPAPFHSVAPLVGVIGIFSAFPAWFAGVLIGLRDVRWYGSRILPLGLALAPVISVLIAAQYWQVSEMIQIIPLVFAGDVDLRNGCRGGRATSRRICQPVTSNSVVSGSDNDLWFADSDDRSRPDHGRRVAGIQRGAVSRFEIRTL
ncbi:MAG: hypothetical protein ACKVHE_30100 [Planctomycetales bacterium]|jgi:hypothetical protein